MKTTVTIEWDKPQEQAWLCPENIAIALHAHCKNTEFKVTESLSQPTDDDIQQHIGQIDTPDGLDQFSYDKGVEHGAEWAKRPKQTSQPTDAKVRDKIENYVDCQIIHGNIDKSEFSWLYAVCEHWFSEGRVNARAFNQEAIKKEKCIVCGGDGFTSEHDPNDPHINGQCSFCPIQVQCEACEGTGLVIKEAIPDRQPSPSGGDAIEFGEWIHEQGYEPWGVTGLWHNIANRKIIPDKIFTTEQLYQQFKETTSNKVTKGDK